MFNRSRNSMNISVINREEDNTTTQGSILLESQYGSFSKPKSNKVILMNKHKNHLFKQFDQTLLNSTAYIGSSSHQKQSSYSNQMMNVS
jgi:hypothetical protein